MIKVEVIEAERKEEIKQGAGCEASVGLYTDKAYKHKDQHNDIIKKLKGTITIDQKDDGKPPKQGDILLSNGIFSYNQVVMFVSDTANHDCNECSSNGVCDVELDNYKCFTGVVIRHQGWDPGDHSVGWSKEAFRKLNGTITITQE